MFKRVLSVCLAFAMLLLCSCSQTGSANSDDSSAVNNSNSDNSAQIEKFDAKLVINELFPTYAPARQVYAVDISELDVNTVAFLRQLQGLVAKTQTASVYLVSNESDKVWLDYVCNELGAYSTTITAEQMVALYGDLIESLVVYSSEHSEFYAAWNDAIRRANAVCADYSVALNFDLLENREVINVHGVFNDVKNSYETLFSMADITEKAIWVSLDETSAFLDYAYACSAYILPTVEDEWSTGLVENCLANSNCDKLGIVYTDYSVNNNVLKLYSKCGFGNIAVAGFSNSTTLSSIGVDYKFEKEKVHNSTGKKGNIYVSLVIDSLYAGNVFVENYAVCKTKREDFCVAIEYPLFLSKLAPATLLWYSINTKQTGDSIIPDGNWMSVDQDLLDEKLYMQWVQVNNSFIKSCGMSLAVTDSFKSGDAIPNYTDLNSSKGIVLYTAESLSGMYPAVSDTAIVFATKLSTITELESSLQALVPDESAPLYFVYSISGEQYFDKIPIYDIYNGYYGEGEPDGYYAVNEIVALFLCQYPDKSYFVSPAQMIAHINKK